MCERLTIAEFQEHIKEKYYETDAARGTFPTFAWFIEEVGELATALHGDDKENLEEEFADVFAWLCTLANIHDVDLGTVLDKKYFRAGGPVGTK